MDGAVHAGEVEEAFHKLWQVGPVGEDWDAQASLYTPDAVYIDHFYGQMTMAEFVPWCNRLMNEEFPELYTVYEWHLVDGRRVVVHMQNRRDNPDPNGSPIDFPGISIYEYAGGGLWSYERDYWSVSEAKTAGRTYRAAVEKFDPAHPSRRSRGNWPASPEWAHP
jgi:SnoaL-like domain